jgi:hypothetical protein
MTDEFEDAHERGETELEFDRWGRYKLKHPETGKVQSFTRATTFAKSISDTFALSQWSQRMVLKGAALRLDIIAMAHSLDVKQDKDKLNGLCEDAKSAAGNKVAANLGTALHSFSEAVDKGMPVEDVPTAQRDDIQAYATAMRTAGVLAVPELIERQTCLPAFEVAGTFDRVLDLNSIKPWFQDAIATAGFDLAGEALVIGDVKSGQDLQYGWNEIAIQLAIYALGVRNTGVWNKQTKSWEPPRPVRLDFAIVMHMPVGQKTCTLWALDLEEAMGAMELCRSVRRWRKMRNLATPLERVVADADVTVHDTSVPSPMDETRIDPQGRERVLRNGEWVLKSQPVQTVVSAGLSWLERFQTAGSRGELSALFSDAVAAGVWSDTLKQAGVDRLKILEEKAG